MFSSNIIVYNLLRTRSSFAKISKSWAIWLYKYFWNVVILVIIHLLILCYIKILFSEIWKTQGLNKVVPKILRIFNFDHKSITWSFLLSCFLPSNFQDISHSFFFPYKHKNSISSNHFTIKIQNPFTEINSYDHHHVVALHQTHHSFFFVVKNSVNSLWWQDERAFHLHVFSNFLPCTPSHLRLPLWCRSVISLHNIDTLL